MIRMSCVTCYNPMVLREERSVHFWSPDLHIDGFMQERRNSSALAMELRLSCIRRSIWGFTTLISIPPNNMCLCENFTLHLKRVTRSRAKPDTTWSCHMMENCSLPLHKVKLTNLTAAEIGIKGLVIAGDERPTTNLRPQAYFMQDDPYKRHDTDYQVCPYDTDSQVSPSGVNVRLFQTKSPYRVWWRHGSTRPIYIMFPKNIVNLSKRRIRL